MKLMPNVNQLATQIAASLDDADLGALRELEKVQPNDTIPTECGDVLSKIQRLAGELGFGKIATWNAIEAGRVVLQSKTNQ